MLPFPIISKTNILPPVVSLQRMNTTENNIGLLYSNNEMYLKGTNAASELGNSGTTTNYATWNLARNDVSDFLDGWNIGCMQDYHQSNINMWFKNNNRQYWWSRVRI